VFFWSPSAAGVDNSCDTNRSARAGILMATIRTGEETCDWIEGICRRFSEATGWPLVYASLDDNPARDVPPGLECCWSSEISDGDLPTGLLEILPPDDAIDERSFPAVRDLAELVSDLIGRCQSATRSLRSQTAEISTLVDIGLSIPGDTDLHSALSKLMDAATRLTGFRSAAFFLLNPETSDLNLRTAHKLTPSDIPQPRRQLTETPPDLSALVCGHVMLSRGSGQYDQDWMPADSATGICMPVQSASGPLGTLWVFDRRDRTPTDRELHVLQSIAAQTASVLERAVLLRESECQRRLQRDLQVASDSHTVGTLNVPFANRGFESAGICTSRHELGGDLCELVPIDDERSVVAVGDASGDSVPAAMVMSAVRGSLRTLTAGDPTEVVQTEQVMRRINQTLYRITPPHQFMSLLYGILDTSRMTFTYTNAGHPPPIRLRGTKSTLLESHGLLLGVMAETTYSHSVVRLRADDLLVLFSDGITEAMSGGHKMFRSDGILEAVRECASKPARDILESVWSKLEQHSQGGSEPDDRTLMVIKMA